MSAYLAECVRLLQAEGCYNVDVSHWGEVFGYEPVHGFRLTYDVGDRESNRRSGLVCANALLDEGGRVYVDIVMYEHPLWGT